jgi:hypothetical protein
MLMTRQSSSHHGIIMFGRLVTYGRKIFHKKNKRCNIKSCNIKSYNVYLYRISKSLFFL